jgi:hypothetical protein
MSKADTEVLRNAQTCLGCFVLSVIAIIFSISAAVALVWLVVK